jgi:hypothetical protein
VFAVKKRTTDGLDFPWTSLLPAGFRTQTFSAGDPAKPFAMASGYHWFKNMTEF